MAKKDKSKMAKKDKSKKEYDPNDVSCPVPDYGVFMSLLHLLHTLLGGTPAMREAAEKYLPREEAETDTAYKNRLARTVLLNAFEKTVTTLSGEVFSEPIKTDNLSDELKIWSSDIDLSGHNIDRFAKDMFETGVVDGIVHILVDLPQVETRVDEETDRVLYWNEQLGEWQQLTIEVMNANDWRPYFVLLRASQLIGWRTENQNGTSVLTQVRIKETTEEPDGKYGVKEVYRIRVLEPGRYEVFRFVKEDESKEGEWISETKGVTGFDFIPLVSWFIGEPLSQMTTEPPLDDLAYLNLAHWQSSSDQRNILHYARMVVFFGKMLGLENPKPNLPDGQQSTQQKAILGSNMLLNVDDPDADLKVVEHTGAAIEAGRNDLKDLEMQMTRYGMSLILGQRPGSVTATEKAIDTAQEDNSLRAWALSMQDVLNSALKMAAKMMVMDEAAVGDGIKVNTDFKSFLKSMEIRELREAFNDGLLPREIVIDELKRRGVISEDIDFNDLMIMLNNEANNFETA